MLGDLDKLIVAKGFKKLPKSKKSPNLVTLHGVHLFMNSFILTPTLVTAMGSSGGLQSFNCNRK